jgi:hypothetical protein
VLRGQIDTAARLIWCAEKLGWVYDVRWPDETKLVKKQTGSRRFGSMTRRAPALAAPALLASQSAGQPVGPAAAYPAKMES